MILIRRCRFPWKARPSHPPGALIPFFWSPGWNSIQATNTLSERDRRASARRRPGSADGRARAVERPSYFSEIPSAFEPREGEWLLVPMHHIFGSDELSLLGAGHCRTRHDRRMWPSMPVILWTVRRSKCAVPAARSGCPSASGRTCRAAWPACLQECLRSPDAACRHGARS